MNKEEDKELEFVVFYDNEAYNLEGQIKYPGLLCVKVYGTDNEENMDLVKNREEYLKNIKKQDNNSYILGKLDNNSYLEGDMVDNLSGINIKQINILIRLIKNNKVRIRAVIFDFDRTFTKIEGLYDVNKLLQELTPEIITKYYLGGSKRVNKLYELFDVMHEYKVDFYILTNNEALGYIYELLKISGFTNKGGPLKYILYNTELDETGNYNKVATIRRKILDQYPQVLLNKTNNKSKYELVCKLQMKDNRDSKFIY